MAYDTQPQGYLAQVTEDIRDALDMGSNTSKWTDSKLYGHIIKSWHDIMTDVNGLGENAIHVQYSLSLSNDTSIYQLPANFGRFVRIVKDYGGQGLQTEVMVPNSRLNPYGGRVLFEGNYIRLEPRPSSSETVTIEYIPDGYCSIHTGEANFGEDGLTSSQIPLDYDPAEGYFDKRDNAYVGQVVRLLKSEEVDAPASHVYWPVQERIITAVDSTTGIATVNLPWDPDPVAEGIGAVTYEIVPFLGLHFRSALVWRVAQKIAIIEDTSGRSGKASRLQALYQQEMRNIRLGLVNKNSRTGQGFRGDVPGSGRFGWSVGNGYGFY